MKIKKHTNRRQFIKKGVQSASLAAIVPIKLSQNSKSDNTSSASKIVYRTLGKTGLKLPVISMGTGDTDNAKLIEAALDSGIKLLATSQYYGNGNNEKLLGDILKGRDRDSVSIMTSAMPDGINHKEGLFTNESKAEPFIEKFNSSLSRLGVDYIDIFLLPFAAKRESVFFEPLLRAMEKIKQQGKARFIGIATHKHMSEAIRAAADTKIYDVVMTSYNFKKKNIDELNKAIDYGADEGLGIIAMKTMAGAYWDKEKTIPINTQAALKWVLKNKNIHTTVPGITTYEQLQDDISIMADMELTDQEKGDLKLAQKTSKSGIYCQQCGICIGQCKESIDIPTIMRSYMYAYGYSNFKHAQKTLSSVHTSSLPCINCKDCRVNCPMGFDIKSKIMDIARLNRIPKEFLG